jgi:hypothetical protein
MIETEVPTSIRDTLDGYFEMWNETDPARRRQIIEQTWTRDARYIEPLMTAEGHGALNAGVSGLQAQFPGHTLRPAGGIDSHHDRVRWRWELFGPDGGEAIAAGTNVGRLASDGRLREVTGFFDHTDGVG